MVALETPPESLIVGRIAYVDPSKQWGYLHGPQGERVYFHATGVADGVAGLARGGEVRYRIAAGGDQLCAVEVVRAARRGR
jgi:cold shock CspA family protein